MASSSDWLKSATGGLAKIVRSKVSADKKRFQENGFDLDLTYITDRIIAMSYPAGGVESTFRNHADEVAAMLNKYHGGHYFVYNLSERGYQASKFRGMVEHIPFPDHHSPPLAFLMFTCHKIDCWLRADPLNVVVIHCLAGKGRTGTVIASYLLFCGLFAEADDALNFYAHKRSINNWGVTGPSQRRYVKYVADIVTYDWTPLFTPVTLRSITIEGVPHLETESFQEKPSPPSLLISSVVDAMNPIIIHDTQLEPEPNVPKKGALEWPVNKILQGDILVNFRHSSLKLFGLPRETKLGRFSFHTGMLSSYTLTFVQREIDEANSDHEDRFPKNFKIILRFEPCGEEQVSSFEEKESSRKEFESAIWEMRSAEPKDGSICFLQNGFSPEKVIEARDTASINRGNFSEKGGWLIKQGFQIKNWKKRWFVIKGDRISYFKEPRNLTPIGDILLSEVKEVVPSQSTCRAFRVVVEGRTFILVAESKSERDQWVKAITKAKHNCSNLPDSSIDLENLIGSVYLSLRKVELSPLLTAFAEKLQKVHPMQMDHDLSSAALLARSPPNWAIQQTPFISVYCEVEYGKEKLTTSLIKIPLDDKNSHRSPFAKSDVISYYGARSLDDEKQESWEQSFKFLIFDLSQPLTIRLLYDPYVCFGRRNVLPGSDGSLSEKSHPVEETVLASIHIPLQEYLESGEQIEQKFFFTETCLSKMKTERRPKRGGGEEEEDSSENSTGDGDFLEDEGSPLSNSTIHLKFIFLKSQAKEVVEEQETPDLLMQNFDPPDLFLDPLSPSQPAPALPPNMRDIPKSHSSRSGTDLVRQNGGSPFGTNFNGTMYSKSSVDRPILSPPPFGDKRGDLSSHTAARSVAALPPPQQNVHYDSFQNLALPPSSASHLTYNREEELLFQSEKRNEEEFEYGHKLQSLEPPFLDQRVVSLFSVASGSFVRVQQLTPHHQIFVTAAPTPPDHLSGLPLPPPSFTIEVCGETRDRVRFRNQDGLYLSLPLEPAKRKPKIEEEDQLITIPLDEEEEENEQNHHQSQEGIEFFVVPTFCYGRLDSSQGEKEKIWAFESANHLGSFLGFSGTGERVSLETDELGRGSQFIVRTLDEKLQLSFSF